MTEAITQLPMNNRELLEHNRARVERWEIRRDTGVDWLSTFGPVIIPLIPATLTASAILSAFSGILHTNLIFAWIACLASGAGIEVLGIVSNETYHDMDAYNETLADGEEPAPAEEANRMRHLYTVIVATLVLLLEIIPTAVEYFAWPEQIAVVSTILALLPLVFLAQITSNIVILRKQHRERVYKRQARQDAAAVERRHNDRMALLESEIQSLRSALAAEQAAKTKLESTLAEQSHESGVTVNGSEPLPTTRKRSDAATGGATPEALVPVILAYIQNHPGETGSAIARANENHGSKSTVQRALDLLEADSQIRFESHGRSKLWFAA
ncbi:MAG TPA: hypothetical protein P5121_05155 [Caldilineaceae bacterium]|nr:hypothetical protein [Caldilineaceae bacterium]